MEDESDVTPNIIDDLHSSDIQGDQMEDESGVNGSVIDELHSWDIQGDQMVGESGVTRSIMDEHSFFGYPTRSNGMRKWCYWKYL